MIKNEMKAKEKVGGEEGREEGKKEWRKGRTLLGRKRQDLGRSSSSMRQQKRNTIIHPRPHNVYCPTLPVSSHLQSI